MRFCGDFLNISILFLHLVAPIRALVSAKALQGLASPDLPKNRVRIQFPF